MDLNNLPDNPYFLLTPGPLSTTKSVKAAMLRDWCTWDDDYKSIVQEVRSNLVRLAVKDTENYTAVLMQGSGTFAVESVVGTMMPENGRLLVITNGVYGNRIGQIAEVLNIDTVIQDSGEIYSVDMKKLEAVLEQDKAITHVAVVHCETTTGRLNPIEKIAPIVKKYGKIFFVDAMSSFGGIAIDMEKLDIDFLVSSANKCIEGVPGFGFIIAKKSAMQELKGRARSLSLDLYGQWKTMDENKGKWRFTSPTHVTRAFHQAMKELEAEGGIEKRAARYRENHRVLVDGMRKIGFETLLQDEDQAPIITSFYSPKEEKYNFNEFYDKLKSKGFVIYPGKVTNVDSFRIGNIGHISPEEIASLVKAVEEVVFWK